MKRTILIDAAHREETRIAVLEDGILQDFDREAIALKQIKGNIYLAKVVRVEPSLQAAFVDYGHERHGFLSLADIHPDYYQIPDYEKQKIREINNSQNTQSHDEHEKYGSESENNFDKKDDSGADSIVTGAYSVEDETADYKGNIYNVHKRYKIQDVIKPGQLILVQVVKEERGNKGASMTTYISIAGKYCVLMPNTPNKGGVSKKVDNFRDRKLLKSILSDLKTPNEGSVIIRTAGVGKKPEEIKRDCDYLTRLWDSIKEVSDASKSPSFIHAEGDVVKRCIRDIYNEQVSEVIVEGIDAFNSVMNFASLTLPGGVNNIKLYEDRVPIFNKFRVEQQISNLYEKQIHLPSGGSIVIDHTEALVAIDVNSGRSTKEGSVEETAYNTNLEAVKEIAKQLRLRDLAGLIVIDFIDMYDQKNRRNVERALRDELQNDRARIQLGRISIFGLLEMSRQRLGASFFETITEPCKHCSGTGYVRSVEILAVNILRGIRHACADKQAGVIYIYTSPETIAYMMNFKRNEIVSTEKNYDIHIFMHPSDDVGSQGFNIKKRKSLSDEERRDLEMEVVTGKVNNLGLEKSYLDNYSESENSYSQPERSQNNNFRRNRHRNRDHGKKHNKFNNNQNKKSLLGSVFSIFSK
jgi:ribonuclease E